MEAGTHDRDTAEPATEPSHSIQAHRINMRDPTFIFSVNQPYDSHDANGTSNGSTIDIVVDTGTTRSVCGPLHCPDLLIESHGPTKDSVADGSQLRHYGEKVPTEGRTRGHANQLPRRRRGTADPQRQQRERCWRRHGILTNWKRRAHSRKWDSRRERSGLGLRRTFCLFFLRATVFAAVVKDGLPRSPIDLCPTLARSASCLRSSITFVCPVGRP